MSIAIDMDDVLWNFLPTWIDYYNRVFDDNVNPKDIVEWDVSKFCKKCDIQSMWYLLEHKGFWDMVKPYPTSQEYLEKLNNEHEVYIATSTYYKYHTDKIAAFLRHFPYIKPEQIIAINNKQLLNVDFLIDDYEKNLIGGKYCKLLVNKPHNKYYKESSDIWRVNNLKEAYDFIKEAYDILNRRDAD